MTLTEPDVHSTEADSTLPEKDSHPTILNSTEELSMIDQDAEQPKCVSTPPRRLSPPVVVLDSSTQGKDAIHYKDRELPMSGSVELVITYVNRDGVIFGVELDEGMYV